MLARRIRHVNMLAAQLPRLMRRCRRGPGVTLKLVHDASSNLDRLAAETALLLRVRDARDTVAFDTLFDTLAARILGYLVRTGGCTQDDGENLLQDVWLTVWTKARLFDHNRAAARTWIFALARNAMIDLKRVQGREQQAFARYAEENIDSIAVDPNHSAQVDGGKAATLLTQLAPEQAQVLLMAYVEGKSHREIARELKLPTGTVKSRLRLGFARMRGLVEGSSP